MPPIRTTLTHDTDEGRKNSSPCLVILSTGQKIAFYSKYLKTGKESFSRITSTLPSFTINVEAGNGNINNNAVSWNSSVVIASPNTYQIVYVDVSGNVQIGANLSMDFLKDVIMLAYVGSGASSITKIFELERTGNYIYYQKQTLVGSEWVWDNYESFINTGTEPKAYVDLTNNVIYLSYKKDSASYVRLIDPLSELTWEYLENISINAGTITLNRNPENTISSSISSGIKSVMSIASDEFPVSNAAFGFLDNGTKLYIILPIISGSYLFSIKSSITYDVFVKVGENYILEDSFVVDHRNPFDFSERYKLWQHSTGTKYIGIRLSTTLFTDTFVTSLENLNLVETYPYPAKVTLIDDNYSVDARDDICQSAIASGYRSSVTVPLEYDELKNFESESGNSAISSGYRSSITVPLEYDELKNFESESGNLAISSGYRSELIITNT